MKLLDAYALVAFVADEPAAAEVEDLLREGTCQVSVVNLAEAIDISQRVHSIPFEEIRTALDPLFPDQLTVAEATDAHAWRAAEIRANYYDRKSRPLSLADCFLLAQASADDSIATSDPPLAEVARAEGIEVVALPDRAGHRP